MIELAADAWKPSVDVVPAEAGIQGFQEGALRAPAAMPGMLPRTTVPARRLPIGLPCRPRPAPASTRCASRLLEIAGWQAAPEGVFIARERHLQALRRVDAPPAGSGRAAGAPGAGAGPAGRGAAAGAERAVNEITGEFSADDLLGVIFSRFCIGK